MVLLLVCTGFDAHQTFGELVLLDRQPEKHNQQKVKWVLPAWRVEPVQQVSHTGNWAGQGKETGGGGGRTTTLFHSSKPSL